MSGGDGTDGDGLMGEAERDTSWSWDRKKGKETTWRRSRRREDKEVEDKNEQNNKSMLQVREQVSEVSDNE